MIAARLTRWMLLAALPVSVAQAAPFGLAVNSDDAEDADQLLRIDLASGESTFIGALPMPFEDVEGMGFDDQEQLYGVDNATKSLLLINADSGSAQPIANRRPNLGFNQSESLDFGMTFTCSGQLLLVAEQRQSLYEVDRETGQASLIGEAGGLAAQMTAIASYGEATYGLAAESNGFYRIDIGTGQATLIATLPGPMITDAGMAFDQDGVLWAVLDGLTPEGNFLPSQILRIDPTNGAMENVAETRTGIESLAIGPPGGCEPTGVPSAPAVPTLSVWGMAALLLTLLAAAARAMSPTSSRQRR